MPFARGIDFCAVNGYNKVHANARAAENTGKKQHICAHSSGG